MERPGPINRILAAAAELQTFCESQHYQFCFIGGLAVQRWGEPRVTNDADLTLLTGFSSEEKFIAACLKQFGARRSDAAEFALARRVLLLKAANGVPLDISLGGIAFEKRTVERASPWEVSETVCLTTCSAEDLIVHKAFAGRGLDWLDVASSSARGSGSIFSSFSRNYVRCWS